MLTETVDLHKGSELLAAVIAELKDERFVNRTHGIRTTNDEGCKGPLCRKAGRDRQARLRREAAEREGRTVRDYISHPVREADKVLDLIIAQHHAERGYKPPQPLEEAV